MTFKPICYSFLFIVTLLSLSIQSWSQEVLYFNSNGYLATKEKAAFKTETVSIDSNQIELFQSSKKNKKWSNPELISIAEKVSENKFKIFGEKKDQNNYQIREVICNTEIGFKVKECDKNGIKLFEAETLTLFPLTLNGTCTTYDSQGLELANISYLKNKLLAETFFFHPANYPDSVLTKEPEFPGGYINFRRAIATNVKFPIIAIEGRWGGQIYMKFLINKKGKIEQISPARADKSPFNQAGIKAISSIKEKWKPAEVDGEKVAVWHYAKITFATPQIVGFR